MSVDLKAGMYVLLDDQVTHRQLWFTDPHRVLVHRIGDPVGPLFDVIEAAQADGHWIAGLFSYEFAAALEPKLAPIAEAGREVVQLGVFDAPSEHPPATALYRAAPPSVSLSPAWSEADYLHRFEAVQRYLRAGDAYQVNLTFPMTGTTDGDAAALYAGYRRRQPGRYGAVVSLGGPDVVSLSPELFFERRGDAMRMRPMKGTRPKVAPGQDADDMTADAKSRAENLMIVDLLRNDLSRLCVPGSVRVPELFAIEDYPTLVQMTSQVTGLLRPGTRWEAVFRALFPCGSVTGAPKIRAMEIIHELEAGPRGPYCGAVGYIAPDGDASFSVAIRTATLDGDRMRYDVGSGVVLDSDGPDEYRECALKARVWDAPEETRFETLRVGPDGPVREARHAVRLGMALPALPTAPVPQRVRIDRHLDDTLAVTHRPIEAIPEPVRITLSRYPLTPAMQRTDVKTSRRDFYDGERARIAALIEADEVVFLSEDGHVLEGSFTSIFIRYGDRLLTPRGPGLLPGVLRAELLDSGRAVEMTLSVNDLRVADGTRSLFVGNSLRGLMRAELISPELH